MNFAHLNQFIHTEMAWYNVAFLEKKCCSYFITGIENFKSSFLYEQTCGEMC